MTNQRSQNRNRFPRTARLTKAREYESVYNSKAFSADKTLVVNGAWNGLDCTRLGLSVSRRVGNAVVRNRWKRLIREAFRLHRHDLPTGIDLVVRPRKGATPDLEAICASLPRQAERVCDRLRRQQQNSKGEESDARADSRRGAGGEGAGI